MSANEIPSVQELNALCARVKEHFISRMRQIYGECDEWETWADAIDMFDRYPADKRAQDFARAALHALIRTKEPLWKP